MLPVLAILGPTAAGKSGLALDLAERHTGEVVSCDSTAVYRGFDIGTDKVPAALRRGIPHHLIDVVDPTDRYTAARYAADAAAAIRDIRRRGRWPILVGGTGFYYRALTRGLFPGPGRDAAVRRRLERIADRRGVERLHRFVSRVDPESGRRIQARDRMRLVRALEVYHLTGRPLTEHFAETVSPIDGIDVVGVVLQPEMADIARRVEQRVAEQFAGGLVDEVRGLLARGVPDDAQSFGGLVYRQVLEMLRGVRDESDTRALIVRENLRYARRQLIWFRKEPNLVWFHGSGDTSGIRESVERIVAASARGDSLVMAQTTESKPAPAQDNIQDAFLNHARRERCSVRIRFLDGHEVVGQIRQFDRFAVVIDCDGTDQMLFKHAIASIIMPNTVRGGGTAD
jgi:tRNA dimethylallyltransferase